MALGLPAHLVQHTFGEARGRAGRVIAVVALLFALAATGAFALREPSWPLVLAALAILAFLIVTLMVIDDFGLTGSIAYLVVGSGATFVFAGIVLLQPLEGAVEMFVLALPKIALIVVGGGTRHILLISVFWALGGWFVAEVSVLAAVSVTTSQVLPLDHLSLGFLLLILLILVLSTFTVPTAQRPEITRAAQAEEIARIRTEIRGQASALLHDVVLSDLAAIALREDGPVTSSVRSRLRADLELLIGQEWIADDTGAVADQGGETRALTALVERMRGAGLRVAVSGDGSLVDLLAPSRRSALLLAVEQALVNVLRHSRVADAELYIAAEVAEVTVMVVDSGIGFDRENVPGDRLGVRQSIEGRMASVGGSAVIWSTPGTGTSVVLRMPVHPSDEGADVSEPTR